MSKNDNALSHAILSPDAVDKLKVVLLDCAIEHWDDPVIRQIFGDLIALRRLGYGAFHGMDMIPFDQTDFIATHFLYCLEVEGQLRPVGCLLFVTQERCTRYRHEFPGLTLVKEEHQPEQLAALSKFMEGKSPECIAYSGRWTALPSTRRNRALALRLKQLIMASTVWFQNESKVPYCVCVGVIKIGTRAYEQRMGYESICKDGKLLDPFPMTMLNGALVTLLTKERHSEEAIALSKSLRHLWENKILLTAAQAERKIAA